MKKVLGVQFRMGVYSVTFVSPTEFYMLDSHQNIIHSSMLAAADVSYIEQYYPMSVMQRVKKAVLGRL